jgi:FkbM family methyltransferase
MRLSSLIGQPFSRLRVVFRAIGGVGLPATFQLFRRRAAAAFGQGADTLYRIRVPGYRHPICIRGGNSSDGFAFYQLLVMKDLEVLDLSSPGLIIDAGANIGMASLYLLNRYPSLKIIAVEPDPGTFELCRMNLSPYSDRVVFVKGAVWSSCGQLVFVREEVEWNSHVRDVTNTIAEPNRGPNTVSETNVECFDIPALISMAGGGAVDLLKMDIEGSEKEVFGKNVEGWLPSIRNIVIELHGPECEKSFRSALDGYRYEDFPFRTVRVCRNLVAPSPV